MGKILEVNRLGVSLKTKKSTLNIVKDISFYIDEKETLVTVGESGCGKTMMARSIMGLLPQGIGQFTEDTEILFESQNIAQWTEGQLQSLRGAKIAMIFQDPMTYLNPTMTIEKQIGEVIQIHEKIDKQSLKKRIENLLKKVQISEPQMRMKQYPHELSGGMRQRVMIAMALACEPQILIADEPTTALDVTTQAEIIELIDALKEEVHMAVLLITHDLGLALEAGDRIQVMYGGKIVETGQKSEIFEGSQHPYTIGLMKSVPELSSKRKSKLYTIEGQPPSFTEEISGCVFAERCPACMKICKKIEPETFKISETHYVSCWRLHPKFKERRAENV